MDVTQGRIIISQPRHVLPPPSRNARALHKCSPGPGRVILSVRGFSGGSHANSVSESPSSDESYSYDENRGGSASSAGKEAAQPLSLRRPVMRPRNQLTLDWQEGAWVQELAQQERPDSDKKQQTEQQQTAAADEYSSSKGFFKGRDSSRAGEAAVPPDTSFFRLKSDFEAKLENSEHVAESWAMRAELKRKVSQFVQNARAQPKTFLRDADLLDLEKRDAETAGAGGLQETTDSDIDNSLFSPGGGIKQAGKPPADGTDFSRQLWLEERQQQEETNLLSSLEPGDYVNNLFDAEEDSEEEAEEVGGSSGGSQQADDTSRADDSTSAAEAGGSPFVSQSWGGDTDSSSKAGGTQPSTVLSDKVASDNVSQALYEWAQKVVSTLPSSGGHIMRRKMNVHDLVGRLAKVAGTSNVSAELDSYSEQNGGISELTASMVVVELCRTGKARLALQVSEWLSKAGIQLRLTSYNSLLAGLVRGSWFEEAYDVFEKMKSEGVKPSVYSYTLLMQVASRTKGYKATLRIFNEMVTEGRCKPDVFAFNCLIAAFGRAHKWKEVAQIWEKMKQDGCKEGMGTYCLLVSTFVRCDQFHMTLEVYASIISRAWKPNKDIFKALVCSCAKEGRWMLALDFLDEMLACGIDPPATVFNALLSAMAKAGETQLVFRGYECMRAFGLKPDPFTWCSLLSGLNRAGEFDRAWKLFETMKDMDIKPSPGVYAAMLMTCLKQESWQTALRLVWEMEKEGLNPDVQIFTLLIKTCEASAQAQVALEVYEHMLQVNVAPNCFTYASLIRVCGKAFNWHKARELFEVRILSVCPM